MQNVQLELQAGFIDRIAENEIIAQRITDGYVNATAMCKAAGKKWNDYVSLSTTRPFVDELSFATGVARSALVQSIGLAESGGKPYLQGTWVHPQVAIHLGQWLSPKFAVAVTKWVLEWSTGTITGNLPYHLKRYMINIPNVPYGYFSMLNEVTLALFGPLEQMGYSIPANMIPDGSLGKTFSNYLRKQGYPVDSYPMYNHEYENGNKFPARAYPNELLGVLRSYFVETWLKEKSRKYFSDRDPKALPYLTQFLTLPNYREVMGYIEVPKE